MLRAELPHFVEGVRKAAVGTTSVASDQLDPKPRTGRRSSRSRNCFDSSSTGSAQLRPPRGEIKHCVIFRRWRERLCRAVVDGVKQA